jgi:hypothetical protein
MQEARYTILVPQTDDIGNALKDLSGYVRTSLEKALPRATVWQEGSRSKGFESYGTVVLIAPETPEVDSHVKQMAHYVGEAANRWGVTCFKEGKQGIKTWQIQNASYRADEPADPIAIADPMNQQATGPADAAAL